VTDQATYDTDVTELLALAARVGLKGFADAQIAAKASEHHREQAASTRHLLTLFQREGIIPESPRSMRLARKWAEFRRFMQANPPLEAGERPDGVKMRYAEWERRLAVTSERYRRAIRAANANLKYLRDWRPTQTDWIKLAIALATRHGEDGFEFLPPRPDKAAERDHVFDVYLDAQRLDRATGLFALDVEGKPAVSQTEAAKRASTKIAADYQAGAFSPADGSDPSFGPPSAGHLNTSRAARNKHGAAGLPPSLRVHQLAREHFESRYSAAIAMSEYRFDAEDRADNRPRVTPSLP